MSRTSAQGWRSFKFWYGAFDPMNFRETLLTPEQREITERLLNHIDEIAYGGWASHFPTLDETDEAN